MDTNKVLLQEDDCAPDARQYFNQAFELLTEETLVDWLRKAVKVDNGDVILFVRDKYMVVCEAPGIHTFSRIADGGYDHKVIVEKAIDDTVFCYCQTLIGVTGTGDTVGEAQSSFVEALQYHVDYLNEVGYCGERDHNITQYKLQFELDHDFNTMNGLDDDFDENERIIRDMFDGKYTRKAVIDALAYFECNTEYQKAVFKKYHPAYYISTGRGSIASMNLLVKIDQVAKNDDDLISIPHHERYIWPGKL